MTNSVDSTVEVAYFGMNETADGKGQVGAMLILDSRGIPKEFRVTKPVRPTGPQNALYGDNLEPFVRFELCGKPLRSQLRSKPMCCIVARPTDVGLRDYIDLPVFYIEPLGKRFTVEKDSSTDSSNSPMKLESATGSFDSLSVTNSESHPEDQQLLPRLQAVFESIDPLEPFERITTALKMLQKEDPAYG